MAFLLRILIVHNRFITGFGLSSFLRNGGTHDRYLCSLANMVGHCNANPATDMIAYIQYQNTLFDFPVAFKTVCGLNKWK